MSGTRTVVTGGSGFIGSHLVDRLLRQGDRVTVFDAVPHPAHHDDVRLVRGDVCDGEALASAITPEVEVVYHLASVVGVDQYLARPLDVVDTTLVGTRNVLERAAAVGAKVVLASTSEVFGKNPAVPWAEDADRVLGPTTADRWVYSTSKALAEHVTFAFADRNDLDATVVRYFNVYGPRQRPAYIVSRSVHRALNGRKLAVYDGGQQTRCFTYIDDVVDATVRAAASDRSAGESFNIGSMAETTVSDAVALIADLIGSGVDVVSVDTRGALGKDYEDLSRRIPDNTKARTLLGWECATSLRDGLRSTIDWAKQNPEWLAQPDDGVSPQ